MVTFQDLNSKPLKYIKSNDSHGDNEMSNLEKGLAAFEAKDYPTAFGLLKPVADQGNAEAQCIIANMYHLGLGLERNISEAVQWYKKSAEQGYGVASNNLATIFTVGDDAIAIDQAEAGRWRQKSREQGFLYAS